MQHFTIFNNELHAEGVPLSLIAEKVGTPCYVYSETAIKEAWQQFHRALSTSEIGKKQSSQINYAVKANSNLSILNLLVNLGSGFDIVSQGELERVLKAGGDPKKIVFSGVGKSLTELQRALQIGIGCINVESRSELHRIQHLAKKMDCLAPVSIRVNPDVNPDSHPYISTGLKENKFGIPLSQAKEVFIEGASLSHLSIQGIAFHIGSQITSLTPFQSALKKILRLIDELNHLGILIRDLNVGGGLAVRYHNETPPSASEYIEAMLSEIEKHTKGASNFKIHLEPGRAIVANAGLLLAKVEYIKEKKHEESKEGKEGSLGSHYFAIVDAAMNDLLRPTLYSVWHDIVPVITKLNKISPIYDIVGPVCETGDFLGKERALDLNEGDLLAVLSAGAYGFSMSSNYNSRPRPAEVLVSTGNFRVVRKRETFEDLFRGEQC